MEKKYTAKLYNIYKIKDKQLTFLSKSYALSAAALLGELDCSLSQVLCDNDIESNDDEYAIEFIKTINFTVDFEDGVGYFFKDFDNNVYMSAEFDDQVYNRLITIFDLA